MNDVKLNKEQEKALKILKSGKNVFLTGQAGTGKSFLINTYIEECKEEGKNVIITAPTGIAAINIGGVTMHSAFAIPIPAYGHYEFDIQLSKVKPVTFADVIIIDEISMCRNDVFEYFAMVLKKIKKDIGKAPQVIVVGDFYQLPPIVKQEEEKVFTRLGLDKSGYCFTTLAWKNMKFKTIELKDVVRQDNKDFIDNLNKLRKGDTSCLAYFNQRYVKELPTNILTICSTNANVNLINEKQLENVEGLKSVYIAKKDKIIAKEYGVDDYIVLKEGSIVMFTTNDVINNKYQNGTTGVVKKCFENNVLVELSNGEEINVYPHEWKTHKISVTNGIVSKKEIGSYTQLPLKLAYAITMHKTQGQTYESAIIAPNSFAEGQLYVALSRLRSIDGLYLESPILEEYVKVNKLVNDFYEDFSYEVPDKIIQKRKELEAKATQKHNEKKKKPSKTAKTKSTRKPATKSKKPSKTASTKKTTKRTVKKTTRKTKKA